MPISTASTARCRPAGIIAIATAFINAISSATVLANSSTINLLSRVLSLRCALTRPSTVQAGPAASTASRRNLRHGQQGSDGLSPSRSTSAASSDSRNGLTIPAPPATCRAEPVSYIAAIGPRGPSSSAPMARGHRRRWQRSHGRVRSRPCRQRTPCWNVPCARRPEQVGTLQEAMRTASTRRDARTVRSCWRALMRRRGRGALG